MSSRHIIDAAPTLQEQSNPSPEEITAMCESRFKSIKGKIRPKPKTCIDCGCSFMGGHRAKRCKPCRVDFNLVSMRDRKRQLRAARKAVTQ